MMGSLSRSPCVNGVEADFHMYLNPRGEAYFLRENVDAVETKNMDFSKCNSLMDANNGQSFSRTLGFAMDRKNMNCDDKCWMGWLMLVRLLVEECRFDARRSFERKWSTNLLVKFCNALFTGTHALEWLK
ncbi:hypothetical protein Tco_0404737 [Tanacetum coccineum]